MVVDASKAMGKAGLDFSQKLEIRGQINNAPTLKVILDGMRDDPSIPDDKKEGLLTALGAQWKKDPQFIAKMENDLKANPELGPKLKQGIISNPDGVIGTVIPQYSGGNMDPLLVQVATKPQAAPAPAAAANAPSPGPSSLDMMNQGYQPLKDMMNPEQKALFDNAMTSTDATGHERTREERKSAWENLEKSLVNAPEIDAKLTEFRQQYPEYVLGQSGFDLSKQTPSAKPQAAPAPAAAAGAAGAPPEPTDPKTEMMTFLAGLSDADMKTKLTPAIVKELALGMADSAKKDFGVEASTADGFKKRIETDNTLVNDITKNFQNNPEFVRQLAKRSMDKTPVDGGLKDMGKTMMTEAMANPEKLKDDAYVKSLSSKMASGSMFAGLGKMFSGLFGEGAGNKLSGLLGSAMEWIKDIFKSIGSWLSQNNKGGSMLGAFASIGQNMDNLAALHKYPATEMTAYPPEGKPFRDVPVMENGKQKVGADGKPVTRQEMNGIEVTDSAGKKHNVMPSNGALMAKQGADGDYRVVVVTGVDQKGQSSQLDEIRMKPDQFAAYKKDMEERSKRPYPSEAYTAPAQVAALNVVKVDPVNGQPTPTVVPVQPADQSAPAVTSPVSPGNAVGVPLGSLEDEKRKRQLAANSPDFSMQA